MSEAELPDNEVRRILYLRYPELYAYFRLGVRPWSKQVEVLHSVRDRPRTMVIASHGVGKSVVAGIESNWHFDCKPNSKCIVTAPTRNQVENIIFGEIRKQRAHKNLGCLMPRAPRMERSANWWAEGKTAADGDGLQGTHAEHLLIVFEEATGIRRTFWESAKGMAVGDDNRWLAIMNPTDTTSEAYAQYMSGLWHVIVISGLDHPNVLAALAGKKIPQPGGITLSYVEEMLASECERLSSNDNPTELDVEWPPKSGVFYRPNGIFEGRVLGRWPTQSVSAVWNMQAWEKALTPNFPDDAEETRIGCDVAREGDDYTEIFVRRGRTVLAYDKGNGWRTTETAGRIIALAKEWAVRNGDGSSRNEDPFDIGMVIDDGGVGGGVTDILKEEGYNVIPLLAQQVALEEDKYPDSRSELWFHAKEQAVGGNLDLSRLDSDTLQQLQTQLFAQSWQQDSKGRRRCRPKKEIKAKIKRSPDTADALNLAFAPSSKSDYRLPLQSISTGGVRGSQSGTGTGIDEALDERLEALLNSIRKDRLIRVKGEKPSRYDPLLSDGALDYI